MYKKIVFLVIVLATCKANAEIYKCVVDGKTEFSGSPCAEDAQKVEVKVHNPSEQAVRNAEAANEFNHQYNKNADTREDIRRIESENARLEVEISKSEKAMADELAALKAKKNLASNNLAGAQWEESISGEMAAVTDKYRLKIETANLRILKNEERIRELESEID